MEVAQPEDGVMMKASNGWRIGLFGERSRGDRMTRMHTLGRRLGLGMVVALLALASAAQAETVTVTDLYRNGTYTIDNGTPSAPTITGINAYGDPCTVTYAFSITDADLDGGGTGNDTLSWTITMSGDDTDAGNCRIKNNGSGAGTWVMDSQAPNVGTRIDQGENITITCSPVTYTLNGGGAQTGSFVGFTFVRAINRTATVIINGTPVAGDDTTFGSPVSQIFLDTAPDARCRLHRYSFQLSTDAASTDPDITVVTPSPKNLGTVQINTTNDTQYITVSNLVSAAGPLNITNFYWTGSHTNEFSLKDGSGNPTGQVAVGTATNIYISFAPTNASARSATLNICSDDPDTPTTNIVINGTGTAGSPESRIGVDPADLAFGTVDTYMTSNLTVVVTNLSSATDALSITNYSYLGSNTFTVISPPVGSLPVSIAIGASSNFIVQYAPLGSIATHTGTVRILSDAVNRNPTNITCSGTSQAGTPAIGVTPASHDFAGVQTSTTSNLAFTVSNDGSGLLSGSASVVGGVPYTIFSGSPYSLPAGTSTNVVVQFAPTAAGSVSDTVAFTGGGGSNVTVTGKGYLHALCRYTGGHSNARWSNGNNWESLDVPNAVDEAALFDGLNNGRNNVDGYNANRVAGQLVVLSPATCTRLRFSTPTRTLRIQPGDLGSSVGLDMSDATVDFNFYSEGSGQYDPWTYGVSGDQIWDVTGAGNLNVSQDVTIDLDNTTANDTLTLNVGSGRTIDLDGAVVGGGSLVKTNAGTVTMGNTNNTYSGGTVIDSGTLSLTDNDDVLPTSGAVSFTGAGTLGLGANDQTVASLSSTAGGAITTVGGGTLTVNQSGDTSYNGSIGGSGMLVKSGAGELTLAGTASITIPLTVSAGTLALDPRTLGGTVSNAAAIDLSADDLGAAYTLQDDLTLNGGSLTIDAGTNASSWRTAAFDDGDGYFTWAGNEGFGFDTWVFKYNSGGSFLGDYGSNADLNYIGSPVNDQAWGLWANSGQHSVAFRGFGWDGTDYKNALDESGDKFLLRMENGTVANGNSCGFVLRNGNSTNSYTDYNTGARLEFGFLNPDTNYSIWDNSGKVDTGIGHTHNGLNIVVTLTGADTYSLDLYWTDTGTHAGNFTGTLSGSGLIESVALYNNGVAGNDVFFNWMEIHDYLGTDCLAVEGSATASGVTVINVDTATGLTTGTFDVITHTGSALSLANFSAGTAPIGHSLALTNEQGNLQVIIATAAGDPDIDIVTGSPLDFGIVMTNEYQDMAVVVSNLGPVTLNVTNFSFDITGEFTAESSTSAVPFVESYTFRYTPTNYGSDSVVLSIWSDDPDTPSTNITLEGFGALTPDLLATNAGSLTIDSDSGEMEYIVGTTTNTYTATIANNLATWTFGDLTIGSIPALTLTGTNAVKFVADGQGAGNGDITIDQNLDFGGADNLGNGNAGPSRKFGGGRGGNDNNIGANGLEDGEGGKDTTYTRTAAQGGGTASENDYRGGGGGAFGGDGGDGVFNSSNNFAHAGGDAYGRLDLGELGTASGPVAGSGGGGGERGTGAGGGGAIQLIALNNITVDNGVTISSDGGAANSGATARSGGAGSGGAIRLLADSDLNGAGTLTMSGATASAQGGDTTLNRSGGGGGGRIVLRGAAIVTGTTSAGGGVGDPGYNSSISQGADGSVLSDVLGGAFSMSGAGTASNAYGNYTSLGVASNQSLEIGGAGAIATLTVSNAATVTIAGTLFVDVDGTGTGSEDTLTVTGALDISAATIDFDAITTPDVDTHVIAQYASGQLTGEFAATNDMPAGYTLTYGATQITLDPGTPSIAIVNGATMDIGQVATNTTDTGIVTVTNSGPGNVIVTNITFDNVKFYEPATVAPLLVVAGATADITVEFAPGSTLGADSALMSILSTDSANSPTNITVQGEGVNPGTPDIVVLTTPVDFGDVGENSTGTFSVVVSNANPGVLSLYLTNIVFSGDDAANFSVVSAPPPNIEVPAGGTTSFTIEYAPGGVTGLTHSSTLVINSDDPDDDPTNVNVQGIGVLETTVTITEFDGVPSNAVSSIGTLATSLTSGALDTNDTVVYTFTIPDADLEGDAVSNDTVTMTMTVRAASLTGNAVASAAGPVGSEHDYFGVRSDSDGNDRLIRNAETLFITPGTVTYTLNGGATNFGSFVGFDQAYLFAQNNSSKYWTYDGGITSNTWTSGTRDLTGTSILEMEWSIQDTSNHNYHRLRIQDIDFTLSTVPPADGPGETVDPYVVSVDSDTAVLGATVASGYPIDSYGVAYYEPSGATTDVTIGTGPAAPSLVYTGAVSSLNGGTLYNFRGWASNATYGIRYSTEEGSFLTEPAPASGVSFSSITHESMTISWTTNAGTDGSLVLLRQNAAVTGVPTDNADYTDAVTAYDDAMTGDSIGGQQVVYCGTATNVAVTALADGVTYHAAVYSYVVGVGMTNYQETAGTGSQLTPGGITWSAEQHATNGESIVLDNLSGTLTSQGARNLSDGASGDFAVNGVIFTEDTTGDPVWRSPDYYGANGLYDEAIEPPVSSAMDELLDTGMYSGTGRTDPTLRLTGLTSGEVYRVQLFHAESSYPTSTIAHLGSGNSVAVSNVPAYAIVGEFTALGTNARVAFDMSLQSPLSAFQVRDTNVPPTTVYSLTTGAVESTTANIGATAAAGALAVSKYGTGYYTTGSTNSLAIVSNLTAGASRAFMHERTGLTEGTLYNFRGFAYDGTTNWSASEGAVLTEPIQASGLALTVVGHNEITVVWTDDATADGAVVIMRAGSAPSFGPVDGTTYTGNSVYGFGDSLGNGYVVYAGASGGSPVGVTGLNPGGTYHVAVYAYATGGGLTNYQQDAAQAANETTTGGPSGSIFDPTAYATLGSLGAGITSITFDTGSGGNAMVATNGIPMGVGVDVLNESGDVMLALYNFDDVNIGAGVTITVTGNLGLVIGSTGDISIASDIDVSGTDATVSVWPANEPGEGGPGAEGGVRGSSLGSAPPISTAGDGGDVSVDDGEGYGGGKGQETNHEPGDGGSYGGVGGAESATYTYGDMELTDLLGGSGGGTGKYDAGNDNANDGAGAGGGGTIELTAVGTITLDASLLADGGSGHYCNTRRGGGGGSGGGILLSADTVNLGASALVGTRGGAGGDSTTASRDGGSGGGGRVAVYADTLTVSGALTSRVDVANGDPALHSCPWSAPTDGTIYVDVPNGMLYLSGNGTGYGSVTNYASLTVTNGATLAVGDTGTVATLNVSNSIAVVLAGTLSVDLDWTGSSSWDLLNVTNDVTIGASAVLDLNEISELPYGEWVTVIESGGTISGTFSDLTENGSATGRYEPRYTTTKVEVKRFAAPTLFIVK